MTWVSKQAVVMFQEGTAGLPYKHYGVHHKTIMEKTYLLLEILDHVTHIYM